MTASSAPVLLLHGFLGAPSSWDEVVLRWAPSGPVVRPHVFGHGLELDPREDAVQRFDDEIERLSGHLRDLPGPAWCVGYSLGARLALGLAATRPERVARLILVSGRDGLLEEPAQAAARAAEDDALADALERDGLEAFVARWERLPLFASQARVPASRRAVHRARRLAHEAHRVARALRVLSLGRMPRYAPRVRGVPTTLVVGAEDEKFRGLAKGLAAELAANVVEIPDAGHDVLLEAPEALAALLRGPA
ncbi:MAG: 2-succinyl-6-hydroxy-2,4-cyclohexadiene-1-carboxy late synthase [Sandaracinaceae bacterium]